MAVVLLYNIVGEKLRKIRTALLRLGLSGRTVSSEEYGHPIGFLAGLEGFGPSEDCGGEDFTGEMMLMSGLSSRQFSTLLDTLRANLDRCVGMAAKAVVTESNALWNSSELYRALRTEHDTMREYIEARKKK